MPIFGAANELKRHPLQVPFLAGTAWARQFGPADFVRFRFKLLSLQEIGRQDSTGAGMTRVGWF